jgi:hypothetical protein
VGSIAGSIYTTSQAGSCGEPPAPARSCSLAEPHEPHKQGEACRPVIVFSSAVHPGATTKHLARTCDLSDTAAESWVGDAGRITQRQFIVQANIHLVANIEGINQMRYAEQPEGLGVKLD